MKPTPDWTQVLEQLLTAGYQPDADATGGAQLTVTDTDGTVVFRRPLARHHRIDDDCVWIRPIIGDGPVFDLADCRRRSLPLMATTDDDGPAVSFALADGAIATITAADNDQHPTLEHWDTFVLTAITAADEAALTQLDTDT